MNDVNSPDSPSKSMERRSTRLTARPAMLAEASDDHMQVDSDYEHIAESSSRGKKRKTREDKNSKVGPQAKRFRGKRGLLRQLVEMPLDVLFEIFGHLKPLDLLHLARTTKDLRAILMIRSSTSIWKHARSQFDDLPDCPDDLSEPQYAELLFGKACTYCHRNLATNVVIWTARVRSCSKCLSTHFSPFYSGSYPRYLLPYIEVITLVKSKRSLREESVYPLEIRGRWEKEYVALKTASERSHWVTQEAEHRKAVKAHARLCEQWVESMKQAQEKEKTALIDSRKAIIMERVKILGWADELSKMDPRDLSLENDMYIVKTCQKDLTDRVLLQVDDFINVFMGTVKAKRLREERRTLLWDRLPILRKIYDTCVETYPINSIIPCVSDVYSDPVVRDLILGPPLSATFTDKNLDTVGALFPDVVLRWRKQTEEKLLSMIAQGTCTPTATESVLRLATSIFSCKFCSSDPLTYPRVLVHRCATRTYYHEAGNDEDLSVLRGSLACSYWNSGNCISFQTQKIVPMTKIIKLCGLDPESATREDMDKQNPIFECLACNDVRKGRCTLSWMGVYVHLRQHEEGLNDLKIELLGDEDAAKVRDRMAETLSNKKSQRYYHGLSCAHCKTTGDAVTLAQHVNECHSKPEPTEQDIIPRLDYDSYEKEHWLWPPRPVAGIPNLTIF